jgi:hypothetical protein|tara:strand:+ start:217 stop:525 length:309 start_codon:yes stop_codon:yes gene_type:complete
MKKMGNYSEMFFITLEEMGRECESVEDLMMVWINIGKKLGVDLVIPHLKVIQIKDSYDEKRIVAIVGSKSEDVMEHLASEECFGNDQIDKCLSIIEKEDVVH